MITILNRGIIMKKFESLWVSALLSAAAPLAKDSACNQSQNQSAEKSEAAKVSDEVELASA